jgi:hypothetical protein
LSKDKMDTASSTDGHVRNDEDMNNESDKWKQLFDSSKFHETHVKNTHNDCIIIGQLNSRPKSHSIITNNDHQANQVCKWLLHQTTTRECFVFTSSLF